MSNACGERSPDGKWRCSFLPPHGPRHSWEPLTHGYEIVSTDWLYPDGKPIEQAAEAANREAAASYARIPPSAAVATPLARRKPHDLSGVEAEIEQAADAAAEAAYQDSQNTDPQYRPSADPEAVAWMLRDIDARIHDFLRRLAPSECPVCGHSLEGGSHEHWGMIYEKPVYPTGPIAPSNSAVEEQS